MPHFEVIPMSDAMRKTGGSRRQQALQQYVDFMEGLQEGQAGKLMPSEGETPLTVRRRLTSAAKLFGKQLEVKRSGDEVYFWVQSGPVRRRRGRPPKVR